MRTPLLRRLIKMISVDCMEWGLLHHSSLDACFSSESGKCLQNRGPKILEKQKGTTYLHFVDMVELGRRRDVVQLRFVDVSCHSDDEDFYPGLSGQEGLKIRPSPRHVLEAVRYHDS